MRGFCIAASLTLASAFVAPTSVSRMGRSAQPTSRAAAASGSMEELRRFTPADARAAAETYGTPCYLYSLAELRKQADAAMAFPNAYGVTARYAMKASPNAAILKVLTDRGLHIDASSGWEVRRAVKAGVPASKISLSSQELPADFAELVGMGATINACSLEQLRRFGEQLPGSEVGLRFNPGVGSGGTGKTNVGGPTASFGIWHEWLEEARAIADKAGLKVVRIHTHIGSGSDPKIWQKCAGMSLDLVKKFPDVTTLNLGGGYKVGRMSDEPSTDLSVVAAPVKEAFKAFAKEDGRELKLEIEPGTFLLANTGAVVAGIQDIVSTGKDGYEFLKLDSGMTEVLRPSLYGAQHPLVVVPKAAAGDAETRDAKPYVVVGHCCESGDIFTPAAGDPDTLDTRTMSAAEVGDYLVVEGAGAYCAGMSAKNYNSFPEAPEVLVGDGGALHLIRKRQTLDQQLENEVALPDGFKN